jgi:YVTN family beta-propeller protein
MKVTGIAVLFLSPLSLLYAVYGLANPLDTRAKITVFTANEGGSLSKIGFPEAQVLQTIDTGGAVHNVQVSPGGKLVAATLMSAGKMDHNSKKAMQMDMKDDGGYVVFYNAVTDVLEKKVKVGRGPAHVDFSPDGKLALVTNAKDNSISIIDMSDFKVTATIPTGKSPHGFRVSKLGDKAFVANMGDKSLSEIDLKEFKEKKRIQLSGIPVTTAISSDGRFVYASLNDKNELVQVELSTGKITIAKVGKGPAQIFLSPDDKVIFVANQGTKAKPTTTVSKVNAQTLEIQSTIESGKGAHGLSTTKDGQFTFVTNMYENSISVIDNSTNKMIQKVGVGKLPNGISISE